MALSAAKKLANSRYQRNKRKTIAADVSKEKGELYQAFASSVGLSSSMLIQNAIEEYIQNHGDESTNLASMKNQPPEEKLSAEERKLLDEFSKLPPDIQKSIAKMIRTINAELESNKIRADK